MVNVWTFDSVSDSDFTMETIFSVDGDFYGFILTEWGLYYHGVCEKGIRRRSIPCRKHRNDENAIDSSITKWQTKWFESVFVPSWFLQKGFSKSFIDGSFKVCTFILEDHFAPLILLFILEISRFSQWNAIMLLVTFYHFIKIWEWNC